MSGVDPERVVAILTPVPGGDYELGTGYVIDRSLVLTAGHVVEAADVCEVRRLAHTGYEFDLGAPLEGSVVWRGCRHDAALVRLGEGREAPLQCFGHVEGGDRVDCQAVGFPRAQLKPGRPDRRDTEEVSGQIAPLTNLRSGALTMHIEGSVPREDESGHSPWEGISGAALFAGPLLVGVVNVQPRCFGTSRLEAVPVAALAEDPEFGQVFRRETGRDFAVEPAAAPASSLPAAVAVMNFLQQYLGDGERLVPFAGRNSELAELDAWLEDADRPNLLLTGLPGRGKSALLARWWQRLESNRDRIRPALVPITIRYELNREADVLAAAVARLAAAQGEDLALASDPADLREQLGSLLTRRPPAGRTTVLILDGLDEAADWRSWQSLLPRRPAPGIKLLASARLTATHPSAAGWLEELGWEEAGCITVGLERLSPGGTRAVVRNAGAELAGIAADSGLVDRLHETADGDPLVLSLYLRHLHSAAVANPRAAVRDLDPGSAGLSGFIERWWQDQRKLWGAGVGRREPAVRAAFNVLATALGPLEWADLLELVRQVQDVDGDELREAIEDLERMVIYERSHAVALSHPRIGEHRLEQLRQDGDLGRFEDLFLDWGRETLAGLVAHKIEPAAASAYLILHYRAHLDRRRRERGISEEIVHRYLELPTPVWLRAWEQAMDQSAGYLEDVDAARRAAAEADAAAVGQGGDAPFLAAEIRCAMARAEEESNFELLKGELLGTLVAEKVWSAPRAIAACEGIDHPWSRAESLIPLIPHLVGPDLRRTMKLMPALVETEEFYEEAVARLAQRLAETEGTGAARAFAEDLCSGRAAALLGLLPHAPAEERLDLVRAAWDEMKDGTASTELLERLTATVDLELAREALGERPAEHLTELVRETEHWWPPQEGLEGLEGVHRAYAMAHRGPWLDPAEAEAETAAILAQMLDEGRRFNVDDALACLAPYLVGDLHTVARAVVEELVDEDQRLPAWASLLDAGEEARRDELLELAIAELADVQRIGATSKATEAISTLARHGAAETCLQRIAELKREGEEEGRWIGCLAALAPHLDAEKVRRALELPDPARTDPADLATRALLARLGSFGPAEAREALELAAAPIQSNESAAAAAALSQIVRPHLDLAGFLPLVGDPLRQAALAIASRPTVLDGGDLMQTVLAFRDGLYPLRLDLSEDAPASLLAELYPRLSDEEIAGEPALRAAEIVIESGRHPRKEEIVVAYMRRLADAAGASTALALGKRLSSPGGSGLVLTWAITGAAGACRDEQETAAFQEAAASIDHAMSSAAAEGALLAHEPAGPKRDARFEELVARLSPGDVELSPTRAALFFDALPDDYRERALRCLVPDEALAGKSSYALEATWADQMASLARVLTLEQVRRLYDTTRDIDQSGGRSKLMVATAARIGVLGHFEEAIDDLLSVGRDYLEPALDDLFASVADAELASLIEFTAERLPSPWYNARRARVWIAASRRVETLPPEHQLRLLQSWLDRGPSRSQLLVDLLLFTPSILCLGGAAACEELSGRLGAGPGDSLHLEGHYPEPSL